MPKNLVFLHKVHFLVCVSGGLGEGAHLHLAPPEGAQITTALGAGAVGPRLGDLGEVFLGLDAGAEALQDGGRLRLRPATDRMIRRRRRGEERREELDGDATREEEGKG